MELDKRAQAEICRILEREGSLLIRRVKNEIVIQEIPKNKIIRVAISV